MNGILLRSIAIVLTVCLLLLSGIVYPQTVAHASHHAHHKAATHATALCTWMCSAGQVIEGIEIVFHHSLRPLTFTSLAIPPLVSSAAIFVSVSRGPPQASA
jgi:hypothetical protein